MMDRECENAGLSKPLIIDNGFMVKVIFSRPDISVGIREEEQQKHSRSTVGEQLTNLTPSLKKLIIALGDDWLTGQELRNKMGYKSKSTFWRNYLSPAIDRGFISLENEESPNAPNQRYGLTIMGRSIYLSIQ